MDKRHIIDEVEFDISFDSEAAFREQENVLGSFIQERLLPLADEIFNELAGDRRVFRMERLEIDLGDVDYRGFREEMEERFRKKLRSVLIEKMSVIAASPSTTERVLDEWQAGRGRLESFLETGRMAWSEDCATAEEIDELLLNILRHEGGAFLGFLKNTPHRDIVAKRLSMQFPDRLLADVVRLLAPDHASRLEELIGKLGDAWKKKTAGITEREFKSRVWQQLISECLTFAAPDPVSLLRGIVADLSACHGKPQGVHGESDSLQADELAWLPDSVMPEWAGGGDAGFPATRTDDSTGRMNDAGRLRVLLESAFSAGAHGEIVEMWDELRFNHGELVREVFMQRMGDGKLIKRLVAGFPETALLELAGVVAPGESRLMEAMAGLPELRAGTGSAKNDVFWAYTLAYLQANGTGFDKPQYVRGLIRFLHEQEPVRLPLTRAIIRIAPELEEPLADLLVEPQNDVTATAPAGETVRAERLYEFLVRRLGGKSAREPSLVPVIAELAQAYPGTLARLLRQLRAGELHADAGALDLNEARQLAVSLIRLTSWGGGDVFLRAVERHAGMAKSEDAFYRRILEKLIRNEAMDLEEAAKNAARETAPANSANAQDRDEKSARAQTAYLRALLDTALSEGSTGVIGAEWEEICRHRAALVRESFIRRMGSESAQEKVARRFTDAMLKDIVRILAPGEEQFIAMLADQPELHPEQTGEARAVNIQLWKHTLSYLHKVAHGGFDRYDYAVGLMHHLSDRGVAWADLTKAIFRTDPALGRVRSEQPGKWQESGHEEGSVPVAATHAPSRADELYERLMQRLSGKSAGARDLAATIDELTHSYPETLVRLQRQLQAGGLRADIGALAAHEAMKLSVSLIRLSAGASGDELLRAIEKHAGVAKSKEGYYRGILESVIRNQVIDLEEAVLSSEERVPQSQPLGKNGARLAGENRLAWSRVDHEPVEPGHESSPLDADEILRLRLEEALAIGRAEGVAEIWGDLLHGHEDMLREVFLRRFGDERVRNRLASGFPESMLCELAGALVPSERGFIETLAGQPELRAGEGESTDAKNMPLWTHTLAYLHASGLSAYDRGEYARGLLRFLAERGYSGTDMRHAIVRADPALAGAMGGLQGAWRREADGERTRDVQAGMDRAEELSRLLARRLSGLGSTKESAQEFVEFSTGYPGSVGRLYGKFQSGEAVLHVTALTEREARLHVEAFIGWSLGSAGDDFRREIESHAGKARSGQRYYQIILERLVRNQIVDIEEAMGTSMPDAVPEEDFSSPAGTQEPAVRGLEQLRARVESALVQGNAGEMSGIWDELCFNHTDVVREVFARRMGDDELTGKLVDGFPEVMLLDLVRMLAPADSHVVELLARLPELHEGGGTKNKALWAYTLGYLHRRGVWDFDRAGYVRGLVRHMQGHGVALRLPQAMIEAVPELKDAIADPVDGFGPEARAASAPASGGRAAEFYEIAVGRLSGRGRGGPDFVEAISELEKIYPEILWRLYRQLQSGELRAIFDALATPEAMQLTVSLARLNSGSRSGEFLRAIERHAETARDLPAYYRNILEKLIRDEAVDLDEAANEAGSGRLGDESRAQARKAQLRIRLDAALSGGNGAAVAADWDEICGRHAELLREGFSRWMASESTCKRTAQGFTESMLEDMVHILAPGENGLIAALAAQPEFHSRTKPASNIALWEYTLGYLHAAANGGLDRPRYVAGLIGHLASHGMARAEVSLAVARVAPELEGLVLGPQEWRANGTGEGTKPGEMARAGGVAQARENTQPSSETAQAGQNAQTGDAAQVGETAQTGAAISRAVELLERLSRRLAGDATDRHDLSPDMAELANGHPAMFAGLVRQLRSGELRADAGALSLSELRQLVTSMAESNAGGPGNELLRAIEQYAGRAASADAYYRNVLERLVRDEIVDLEEAARASLPETPAQSPASVPESEENAEKGNIVQADEPGPRMQEKNAAWTSQTNTPDLEGREQEETMEIGEEVYIANAGMVLLAPYMPQLFRMLDLTEGQKFKDARSAERAIHLLQFAVNESCDSPEFLLALNKILCGVVSGTPIVREIELAANEKETIEGMLGAVIRNWTILGSTSVQGLRESFLQRKGRLQLKEDAWHLKVEQKGIDVLLDRLPWSYSLIRHPWMKLPVYVEWR